MQYHYDKAKKASNLLQTSKDPSETPITQADINSGKLKLIKRDASGALVKPQQRINIFLDSDTVQYFKSKAGERGYQTLINETLKQATRLAANGVNPNKQNAN